MKEDYADKVLLTDKEGAEMMRMSLPTFRAWSEKIGARRKFSSAKNSKTLNVRAIIEKAIMEGKQWQ